MILFKIFITLIVMFLTTGFVLDSSSKSPTLFNRILAGVFLSSGIGAIITFILALWFDFNV